MDADTKFYLERDYYIETVLSPLNTAVSPSRQRPATRGSVDKLVSELESLRVRTAMSPVADMCVSNMLDVARPFSPSARPTTSSHFSPTSPAPANQSKTFSFTAASKQREHERAIRALGQDTDVSRQFIKELCFWVPAMRPKCGVPVPVQPPPPPLPPGTRLRNDAVPLPPMSCRLLPLRVWTHLFEFFSVDFICNTLMHLCRAWRAAISRDLLSSTRSLFIRGRADQDSISNCISIFGTLTEQKIDRLVLERCVGATPKICKQLVTDLPRLRVLRLDACDMLTDEFVIPLLQMSDIESVSLAHSCQSKLSSQILQAISKLSQRGTLIELCLSDVSQSFISPPAKNAQVSSAADTLLGETSMRTLRALALERNQPFHRDHGPAPALRPEQVGVDFVTDSTLQLLQNGFSSLQVLSLSGMSSWTMPALQKTLRSLPNLNSLDLSRCEQVDDKLAFSVMRIVGPRLQYLSLFACSQLSDAICNNLTTPYCPKMMLIHLPDHLSYESFCSLRMAQRAFIKHQAWLDWEEERRLQASERPETPPPEVPDRDLPMLQWSAKFCPHHVARPKSTK